VISDNLSYKFVNDLHNTSTVLETFAPSPIVLYNSRLLAYVFLVLYSSAVESLESQDVMLDSISFNLELGLSGDLMSIEGSYHKMNYSLICNI